MVHLVKRKQLLLSCRTVKFESSSTIGSAVIVEQVPWEFRAYFTTHLHRLRALQKKAFKLQFEFPEGR